MKRCPECRRDYYDDTLLFCLDDGSALLDGPASGDEPATAILPEGIGPRSTSEPPTRQLMPTSEPVHQVANRQRRRSIQFSALIAAVVVLAGAFFGYRYFGSNSRQIGSIAVMPFVNESGEADIDYLADGVTETLINGLSTLPDLNVRPRSTVFRYKNVEWTPKQVASELSVQRILTGRISRRGDQLTLSLELIESEHDRVIWGHKYERRLSDLVSLQGEIAKDVSARLRPKLSRAQAEVAAKNDTADPEAYRLYLKGRYYWDKRTRESFQVAIDAYKQALSIDPNYALAYVGLADCYLFSTPSNKDRRESMLEAKAAALKALELDPSSAEAHTTLAFVKENFEYDMAGAEAGFRRAIELDPNYSIAHQFYGGFLIQTGRTEEGLAEARRALDLEPYSLALNWYWGLCLYMSRRYDEAIAQSLTTLQMQPRYALAEGALAQAYIETKRYDDALALLQAPTVSPERRHLLAYLYAVSGRRAEALAIVNELTGRESDGNPYQIAQIYAGLGDSDRALDWLEKGYEQRTFQMFFIKAAPPWDALRSKPRFIDLLKRMNLTS